MILLIDNYDSFSYNLYQLIGTINPDIKVIRNDELTVAQIAALAPSHIVLSPGPGRPENAGVIMEVATTLGPKIPTLGVCLGHQAICAAYGATVSYAQRLMHGKQSEVLLNTQCPLFQGLPEKTPVARYHSLSVVENTLPESLQVVSRTTDDQEVMAIAHRNFPLFGVQFHPESVMTPRGLEMLRNFLELGAH
ncbi:MAG: aminodeoxychorismate/anthranilate synthase component II [Candidatus Anaerobiospirillum pullicola]|uniref:Aminodeoxychorismate/anthranilate synthase component II n=1 Tax=Candidatus Anaerobiospirillum pullicola TaxID=2838451 RepID=A0A948TFG8_9GAMM|nr:aminodeoxychorismate/anthranilate synthase component II [Candidatus Anaerobiospirillum pullicola]